MRGVLRLAAIAVRRGERTSMAMMIVVIALATAGIASAATLAGGAGERLDAAFAQAHGPDLVVTSGTGSGGSVHARCIQATHAWTMGFS